MAQLFCVSKSFYFSSVSTWSSRKSKGEFYNNNDNDVGGEFEIICIMAETQHSLAL